MQNTEENKLTNYDKQDRIDRDSVIIAGPLKIAAYRVRDPQTDEWSKLQFHMTYDNTVMAVMSEAAATLFAKFVTDTMGRQTQTAAEIADVLVACGNG